MAGPFVLEFYKPDPKFYTPQGGSTYLPLTGDWLKSDGVTRYGVAFSVSDTDTFDFGAQLPNLVVSKSLTRFGDKIQRYTLKDRAFKCSVYALGDTLALAKYGIQMVQDACMQATQFTTSAFMNDGLGDSVGQFLYLKYQPDSTTSPVYFRIISGYVDLSSANDQSLLNANMMKVNLNLRISFAGYGPAVWLQNLVPNGTFANGFKGYAFSGLSAPDYSGNIPTIAGPGMANLWLNIPGHAPTLANHSTSVTTYDWGIDQAWGLTNTTTDVWSGMAYNAGGQAGTDIIFTPETSFMGTDAGTSNNINLWLAFEYTDNAASGSFCSAQLQVWNTASTGAWSTVGPIITPPNNTANARYAWNAVLPTMGNAAGGSPAFNWRFITKYRIAFSFDRSRSFATQAIIRKIALWAFPAFLPSAMQVLPTEYVSQGQNMTQSTFITGIQGNGETPVRAKLANPLQLLAPSSGSTVVYQRAYIGARKFQKAPYRYFYKYTTSNTASLTAGVNFANLLVDANNMTDGFALGWGIPPADQRARQYRVLGRFSSNSAIGTGISNRSTTAGDYTIVPNASLAEIPSTATVTLSIDCGIATVPPYTGQHADDGGQTIYGPTRRANWWFSRSLSSIGGTISVTATSLWMVPTDQYMDIDTRQQDLTGADYDTSAWSNFTSQTQVTIDPRYAGARELVIDTMFRTSPSVFMGSSCELDGGSVSISPVYTGSGFTFLPATPASPEPMQFCAVVRRQGTSGAPNTDVTEADPIQWTFLYMPAWEF